MYIMCIMYRTENDMISGKALVENRHWSHFNILNESMYQSIRVMGGGNIDAALLSKTDRPKCSPNANTRLDYSPSTMTTVVLT